MAATLDFSKFSFTAEQIRSVKDLLFDEIVKSPELAAIHTIYPGIVYDKEVGFIGKAGLLGIPYQGCNPTPQGLNIATRKITWQPKQWEVFVEECKEDIESTAAVYSLNYGVNGYDFSEGDYVNIIVSVLAQGIKEFLVRTIWFADTDAANKAAGGEIKDGIDTQYFSLIDGLFKQIDTQVTANAAQRVDFTGVTAANVQEKLSALVYGAAPELRQKADGEILVSQSVYDLYEQSLAGAALETMYKNLTEGQKQLTFKGIPVIAMPLWDATIAAYLPDHAKHIAVYSAKSVLALGVDDERTFSEIDVDYDKKSRVVLINAGGKLDAKLANPALVMIGK